MLNKNQRRNIEFDRLEAVLEDCHHYLNGMRNKHNLVGKRWLILLGYVDL